MLLTLFLSDNCVDKVVDAGETAIGLEFKMQIRWNKMEFMTTKLSVYCCPE